MKASDVADTGLLAGTATLVSTKGCTVTVSFENGEKMVIDSTNIGDLGDLKSLLTAMQDRNGLPSNMTVTITNTASGESVDYTVAFSEAE